MALSSTDQKPESSTSPEQEHSSGFREARSVLLCGASVRSLAESAIAAGLRPLCVDFFQDDDLTKILSGRRGRFVAKIQSFAELPAVTRAVRASIPMIWAGGLENRTDILREIACRRPLIGADPDLIDQVRNLTSLSRWLTAAGIDVPRCATEATADANIQWLRKPMAGSGGQGIKAHCVDLSYAAANKGPRPSSEFLQEYIDGVPMSAVFFSNDDGVDLIGTSLQLIGWPSLGASDFLFCGNVGPVDPGKKITEQILLAAKTIVAHTHLRGVFGIDFVLQRGRAWLLEVNPRLTASHMLYESKVKKTKHCLNLVEQHLAAFGWRPAPAFNRKLTPGARIGSFPGSDLCTRMILWAGTDIEVSRELRMFMSVDSDDGQISDIPALGTIVPGGSPICSVHVSANSADQLFERVKNLLFFSTADYSCVWPDVCDHFRILFDRFQRNQSAL